jgi:S1-C subfamily serine protease
MEDREIQKWPLRCVMGVGFLASSLMAPALAATDYVSRIAQESNPGVVTVVAIDSQGNTFGQGTGFIASSDGVVVTCYHVIKGAHLLAVKLLDGDLYDEVGIIETDPRRDIAVLKIKAANLRSLRIGDSNRVAIGEPVVAITNPQGLEHSVADGRVSAIRDTGLGYKLFQITVPISQGSSGGPVFNSNGEVVGVASLQMLDSQNLNFAVPVNYIAPLVKGSPKKWLSRAPAAAPTSSENLPEPPTTGSLPLVPPSIFAKILRLPGELNVVEPNGLIKVHDSYGYTTPILVTQSTAITSGNAVLAFKDLKIGMKVEVEYGSDSNTRQRYALKIKVL